MLKSPQLERPEAKPVATARSVSSALLPRTQRWSEKTDSAELWTLMLNISYSATLTPVNQTFVSPWKMCE